MGAAAALGGGLGIGLSLVRGIVELHGGAVERDERRARAGQPFVVRLPLAVAAAGSRSRTPAAAPPRAQPGVRVLVADDNRDAADTLCRILALYGYEVRSRLRRRRGARGLRGVPAAGRGARHRHAGRNGYEVARELRARRGAGLRLVALTGWGAEGRRAARAAKRASTTTSPSRSIPACSAG